MPTAALTQELFAESADDIYWELVTIEHPTLVDPIRVVNAREEDFSLVSRGDTFLAYPFEVTWPARDPDQPFGGARLVINNVVAQDGTNEPVALAALRGISTPARVRFELVRKAAPDTVEQRTTRLRLVGIDYDVTTIAGSLEMPDLSGRRVGGRFTPDRYRNLRA